MMKDQLCQSCCRVALGSGFGDFSDLPASVGPKVGSGTAIGRFDDAAQKP